MEIRVAGLEELAQIDAFDVFSGNREPDILLGEIIVAMEGNEVAAYLKHNKKFYQRPFVSLVCVKENHRRKGINTLLFAYIENLYKNEQLLFTSTEADNLPMLGFLEKAGYNRSGAIDNLQKVQEVIFVKKIGG